jgi:hypothetical protein
LAGGVKGAQLMKTLKVFALAGRPSVTSIPEIAVARTEILTYSFEELVY